MREISGIKVDWKKWEDEKPESAGTYLTYWSDKALETYPIGVDELEMDVISVSKSTLLCWAENVEPPEL